MKKLWLNLFLNTYAFILNKTFVGKIIKRNYIKKTEKYLDNFDEYLESI